MASPSANYTAERDEFGRTVQFVVEIDMDICSNDYTVGSCTASDAGDGARCFYSFPTCQDRSNFASTSRTYRFCYADRPLPYKGAILYPYIKPGGIQQFTQKIDPDRGITRTEKLRINFYEDFNPPPFDLDTGASLYNTASTGAFGRRFVEIHRNYPGRAARIKRGFVGLELADFWTVGPKFQIARMGLLPDGWYVELEDTLTDLRRISIPAVISEGNLLDGAINDAVTSITVDNGGEFTDPADLADFSSYFDAVPSGYTQGLGKVVIEVGDATDFDDPEYMNVTAISGNTLTVQRGRWGTDAASHVDNSLIREVCWWGHENSTPASAPTGANCIDCMLDLLNRAGIAAADIDTTTIEDVRDTYWSDVNFYRTLTDHKKIFDLMKGTRQLLGVALFIDDDQDVSCVTIGPPKPTSTITDIDEDEHIIADSVRVDDDEESRVTRVTIHYDPTEENPGEDPSKYSKHVIRVDAELETADNYGDERELEIFSNWLDPSEATATVGTIARRLISRYRQGIRTVQFDLELKDFALQIGQWCRLSTARVQDAWGNNESKEYLVIERKDTAPGCAHYVALDGQFVGRYLWISPSSLDGVDWKNWTADQQVYGCWGTATDNLVEKADGTFRDGFLFW